MISEVFTVKPDQTLDYANLVCLIHQKECSPKWAAYTLEVFKK
jgi:hypothetical protein